MHALRTAEAVYLEHAAAMQEAFFECLLAAWSVRKRLGRKHTPPDVSAHLFGLPPFPPVPPVFTDAAQTTEAYARWNRAFLARLQLIDTNGVDDLLRATRPPALELT